MRRIFSRSVFVLALFIFPLPAVGQESPPLEFSRGDPAKYEYAERCGECHESEIDVWEKTPHSQGFKTMHRKKSAKKIAEKLGFKLIKRNSLCIRCHYTPIIKRGQLRAASGVSCESCHGTGKDWIDLHNDYGGKGVDYKTEAPEHRARRVKESREAGMRRPSDLYPVVENCFQCHLVPEERLVNVGGHGTGSGDFEFVKWSQGEIRHNFLGSDRKGSSENAERSPERKRLMYVVGRGVELEYALRGMAGATEKGIYGKAMARRARIALGEIREIGSRVKLQEVNRMLGIVRSVKVGINNKKALLKAADQVSTATQAFIKNNNGSALGNLDPLILDEESEEQEVASVPQRPDPQDPVETSQEVVETEPIPVQGKAESREETDHVSKVKVTLDRMHRGSGSKAVGQKKTRVRPVSKHKTLGSGACSKCHSEQNEWWFDDKHYTTAEPFFDQKKKVVKIARLYGIKPSDATKGNQLCMDCHGTIVSGKEKREVQDGVSCESCHGPAKDYLKPHEKGDKELGDKRPGYIEGLKLGLVKMKDPRIRAMNCGSCHYITERRLISAGHTDGAKFDYAKGLKKVKHWERTLDNAAALGQSYNEVLASRGPVPKVAVVIAEQSAPVTAQGNTEIENPRSNPAGKGQGGPRSVSTTRSETNPTRFEPPPPRPAPIAPIQETVAVGDIELSPFPEFDDSVAVEERLLIIKERLDHLYRTLYEKP